MRIRDLDPSLLRAFVAIVDAGSFGKAAKQLNRTQSALSMQISRLEDLVDAELFDRSVRPVALMPAGETLIPFARDILATNDAAIEQIRDDKLAGQVRLGIMEDIAATQLGPIIGDFLRDRPGVLVEVQTGITATMLDRLGSDYDILVAMTPAGHDGGEFIYRGEAVWGAASTFDIGIDPLPVALYPHECLFRKWAVNALDSAQRHWRMALLSASLGSVTEAVRAGWCISVFKDCTFPQDLCVLPAEAWLPELPEFEIRLFRAPVVRSPAAHVLADTLVSRLTVSSANIKRRRRICAGAEPPSPLPLSSGSV